MERFNTKDGFVKVAAVTPKIRVADTKYERRRDRGRNPGSGGGRRKGDRAAGACHHGIYLQ